MTEKEHLYQERAGPSLFGEPLNVATNLGFFAAAVAVLALMGRVRSEAGGMSDPVTAGIWTAAGLILAIGAGSTLFHMFASAWARVLDVVPILLFQLSFLWLYGRWIVHLGPAAAAGALALFLAAALIGRRFPRVLNGSLTYAPAVILLAALGIYHRLTQPRAGFSLIAAAVVFLAAVFFRSIDRAGGAVVPRGTHFLWHLLVSAALYLSMRALLLNVG